MTHQQKAVEALRSQLGGAVLGVEEFRGETTLVVEPARVGEALRVLRDEPGLNFNLLAGVTASDHLPEEPRFHIVYQVYSMLHNAMLALRANVSGDSPSIATVESVFPNANWYEREIYDMFGVRFEGHSDMRRILMPADWQGHPLRKDFPLGYEEVQFSFNYKDVDRKKPYAKE